MATVLVVDDEPGVLRVVEATLRLEGHDVLTAPDGEAGLARLAEARPDVVVLDVMLPGMDGWAVLERMKHGPPDLATVPVVMLTARAMAEDRIRGGIEGAVRYLTKPFDPARLRDEVRGALEGGPEPEQRRRARQSALEELVRREGGGDEASAPTARPHLTRLEHVQLPAATSSAARDLRARVADLSPKQRALLVVLRDAPSVSEGAAQLGVSRSNVYASLRRICRKLATPSVPDLLDRLRAGELTLDEPGR